jgi:hypothetical protein
VEEKLKRYWSEIRKTILSRWGHQVQEEDLEEPMSYEKLCEYFGEKCGLKRGQAEERIDRVIREIEFRPPGV